MAIKKPAPKKVAKPAAKPVKKAATATKAAAKKKAAPKPASKNAVKPVKKAAPVKKSAVKKSTVSAKPAPKKAAKVIKKAAPAKPSSAKKVVAPAKKVVKPTVKPTAKVVTKPAAVKVTPPPVEKIVARPKPEIKVATTIPTKPVKKQPEPIKEVKVPKISIKTSVPYQPIYTPLEKRADTPKTNDPLVKYSDSDLNEFRELINKKLDTAKKELAYLQGLITRKDEMGGDDNDNRYMTMEDGTMSMEREQLSQMASRQITYIDHLEKAMIRIENKTYGICRVTGKLIDKARLRAVPHATLSLEAKLGLVKPSSNEQ